MAHTSEKPKRCKECPRLLKSYNKSELCNYHLNKKHGRITQEKKVKARLEYCGICGAKISGKLRINIGRGVIYGLCTPHFREVEFMDTKEIKRLIYNKLSFKSK